MAWDVNKLDRAGDLSRLPEGRHEDGKGLRLIVTPGGDRKWEARVSVGGKRLDYTIGQLAKTDKRHSYRGDLPPLTKAQARDRAAALRLAGKQGRDLIAEERAVAKLAPAVDPATGVLVRPSGGPSFRDAFEAVLKTKLAEFSNPKHRQQWRNAMESYVLPTLGNRPVADITPREVIDTLQPIWSTRRETASRLLQRMAAVFRAAIVRGDRTTANPTEGVSEVLGKKRPKVEHHRSMPYPDLPALFKQLMAMSTAL